MFFGKVSFWGNISLGKYLLRMRVGQTSIDKCPWGNAPWENVLRELPEYC